jgi:transcriptional regulator with XRE-family HTH domain
VAKDWDAVAEAINTRLAELEMTQTELATKSRVSPATLRQIQHGVPKRRSPRTLADISEALSWPSDHLERVSEGAPPAGGGDRVTRLEAELNALRARVDALESGGGS